MVDDRGQFIGALVLEVSVTGALFVWVFLVIIQFTYLILWEVQDIIEGQEW